MGKEKIPIETRDWRVFYLGKYSQNPWSHLNIQNTILTLKNSPFKIDLYNKLCFIYET